MGDEGSEFQRQIIFPGALRLLALKAGENVLDVACGQGVFCRVLAERGAKVTGVDAALELIKVARARARSAAPAGANGAHEEQAKGCTPNSRPGAKVGDVLPRTVAGVVPAKQAAAALVPAAPAPEYLVGDVRNLSFLPAGRFAAGTCILAIQNIDKLPPVFVGVSRALAPMGRLVLVMMHPCFRGPKCTSWGWDEKERVQYRRTDRYILPRREPIFTHPGKKDGQYTWSFHRPIESYVKALRGAGLFVDAMEEWASHKVSTSGPRAGAENTARKEIPMFLAIRAVKVPLAPAQSAEMSE